MVKLFRSSLLILLAMAAPLTVRAEGDWEITPESEAALARGLEWLAKNQGPNGKDRKSTRLNSSH